MTNQNFTAEQREIIETMFHHASVGEFLEGMSHYVRDLKNLRPNPPLPPSSTSPTTTNPPREDTEMRCEWFALCDNPATDNRPGPMLTPDGIEMIQIPVCDRCAARADQ